MEEKINKIIETILKEIGISKKDFNSKKRNSEIVLARQIACYILREKFIFSYRIIGEIVGNLDHSSVIYSINKVKDFEKYDKINFIKLKKIENDVIS